MTHPAASSTPRRDEYDAVVVGGGAAGLSAAVALARSRRSVLVVDDATPRNAVAAGVHNLLGLEGISPLELLARGRDTVRGYGGEVVTATVARVAPLLPPDDGGVTGFAVTLLDGAVVHARRLVVATGLADELPEVEGLAARWGRDVLHCPYCHGYEVRDQAVGVLATGPSVVHQALMFAQLTHDVTVLAHTGPGLTADQLEQLAARGVRVVDGEVAAVEVDDDRLTGVRLTSGEVVGLRALVVAPFFAARTEALAGLGLATEDVEMAGAVVGRAITADPLGATSVPGVWVAGNVRDLTGQVGGSAAAGVMAGAVVNADLIAVETAAAVARLRAAVPA